MSGSTWLTSGSGIASTPGITVRICRTCATGPGPTERPGPQRRLQLAEGQHRCDRRFLGDREGRGLPWRGCHPADGDREDGAVTAIEAAGRAGLSGRGRWASRGARRDQVRIGGAGRRPGFEGDRGTCRVRAAAQPGGGRHHPSHSRCAAGYPAGRGLRYRVPLDTRRGAVPLSIELALVVAHLGSGCSVTAVLSGRSVATSMGLTPMEGLMMGTRSGSIDPGILLYMLRTRRAVWREIERAAGEGNARARVAIDMFVSRAAAGIAAVATALPRLDGLVFTGGIGEHSPSVRSAIVGRLAPLGISAVPASDVRNDAVISRSGAATAILRIEAREDAVIARQTADV